jgi:hypothetical protein
MRGDTSERLAHLGIERPGHEKNVALKYQQPCQDDNRQRCNDNARASDKTGARIIHNLS